MCCFSSTLISSELVTVVICLSVCVRAHFVWTCRMIYGFVPGRADRRDGGGSQGDAVQPTLLQQRCIVVGVLSLKKHTHTPQDVSDCEVKSEKWQRVQSSLNVFKYRDDMRNYWYFEGVKTFCQNKQWYVQYSKNSMVSRVKIPSS